MSAARRTRMALVASLVVVATACLWTPSSAAEQLSTDFGERLRATDKALRCLESRQNADGGFGEGGSDPDTTVEVVLAFASAYEEPASVQETGNSPLDYLATQTITSTGTAEDTSHLILAVVAGNEDPRDFRGTDLVTTIKGYRQSSGQYTGDPSDGIVAQVLAILALLASKEPVPPNSVAWLLSQQYSDGGWGSVPDQPDQDSDTEITALALQALVSAGQSPASTAVRDALDYLNERQTVDAGFTGSAAESGSDPVATARAIQALLAAGEDLLGPQWSRCLRTPFDALLDAQSGDGSFENDAQTTAVSVPGLMGRSMPLPGRGLAALKGLEWLATQQQTDGGFGNGGFTADAVYAIALLDQNPDGPDWTKSGGSALDALEEETPGYIAAAPAGGPAGELAKVIRAVQAAGGNPYDFAGMDLVAALKATYNSVSGRYHPYKVFSHDLALMALQAVGESIPAKSVTAIEEAQLAEGGWAWGWDTTDADVDTSGLSMQSIVAGGGPSSPDVADDFAAFLQSLRFPGGAYPDVAARPEPNCNSTALAIQGLLASGDYREPPLIIPLDTGGVISSWDALLGFQEPSGSFAFTASGPESRLLATLGAVIALSTDWYPSFEPVLDGDATTADEVRTRLTCGNGLEILAPYSGDDDDDGSATVRYRVEGETLWSAPSDMGKTGIAYRLLPPLEERTAYEIEVTYDDPDGVSGETTQYLTIYVGKTCTPLILRAYAG